MSQCSVLYASVAFLKDVKASLSAHLSCCGILYNFEKWWKKDIIVLKQRWCCMYVCMYACMYVCMCVCVHWCSHDLVRFHSNFRVKTKYTRRTPLSSANLSITYTYKSNTVNTFWGKFSRQYGAFPLLTLGVSLAYFGLLSRLDIRKAP
jgi:hypothetical protein